MRLGCKKAAEAPEKQSFPKSLRLSVNDAASAFRKQDQIRRIMQLMLPQILLCTGKIISEEIALRLPDILLKRTALEDQTGTQLVLCIL